MPLIAGPSSSPVISSEIDPGTGLSGFQMRFDGRDETGDATLHVHRPAPEHLAVHDFAGKRPFAPVALVSRWHHIGVPGKAQVRPIGAEARIKVLHIRGVGSRKAASLDAETESFQP